MAERILVVDDEEAVRTIVVSMLSSAAYECQEAVDGLEALALLDSGKEFDLLLSGLMMPDLDGIGLLERVKDKYSDIPFVEWLFRILERARQEAAFSEEGVMPVGTPDLNGQNESDEEGKDKITNPPTVEVLLAKVQDPAALERIKEMMRFCEALPSADRYTTRHHIVYRTNRAFAKIYPQRLQFWVDVIREGVADPYHLLKHKHPVHGHIEVPNDLDLQKVKDLVQQSYKSTLSVAVGAN